MSRSINPQTQQLAQDLIDPLMPLIAQRLMETGSWTPIFSGTSGAGSYTYVAQAGRYVRIGALVIAQFYVQISAISVAPVGSMLVSPLPFTSSGNANYYQTFAPAQWGGITLTAGYTQLAGRVDPNAAYIQLLQMGSAAAAAFVGAGSLGATAQIIGTAIYEAG